jgi:hypothetical protein
MPSERLAQPAETRASDDEQERGLRLLLLGKGAVFAQRFERSLAAEMDDFRQRAQRQTERGRAVAPRQKR